MKFRVKPGGGFRKRQLDLLPSLEIGWWDKGFSFDIVVGWLNWYGYIEVWESTNDPLILHELS